MRPEQLPIQGVSTPRCNRRLETFGSEEAPVGVAFLCTAKGLWCIKVVDDDPEGNAQRKEMAVGPAGRAGRYCRGTASKMRLAAKQRRPCPLRSGSSP
ncbi:hypothetical protein WJX72_002999 [[Myrmecia] bisecta]|uniref:Uncharacterized protein n=1 Tax=[Myrmecia] bisecta TaxID=41462 RepID=A0AAW1P3U6_9CHLO